MFIFAQLKYNDKSFLDTIVPLARVGVTHIHLGLGGVQSIAKQLLNTDSLILHCSLYCTSRNVVFLLPIVEVNSHLA